MNYLEEFNNSYLLNRNILPSDKSALSLSMQIGTINSPERIAAYEFVKAKCGWTHAAPDIYNRIIGIGILHHPVSNLWLSELSEDCKVQFKNRPDLPAFSFLAANIRPYYISIGWSFPSCVRDISSILYATKRKENSIRDKIKQLENDIKSKVPDDFITSISYENWKRIQIEEIKKLENLLK